MKTLQVLEPEKLTPEEVKALRAVGFDVYGEWICESDRDMTALSRAKTALEIACERRLESTRQLFTPVN